MGGGSWTADAYTCYATRSGRTVNTNGFSSTQNMFTSEYLDEALNPKNVIRECCDSEEHTATVPVILALDVTGSMGSACKRVAQSLNVIMTDLYKKYKDIEFMIMGIGDLSYDEAPIQASQFESDIRIAEQTDKIYFEGGGGGNRYESYTAAWYFGLNNCKLDCWNRGKKGIIITLGDEPLNPYLPVDRLKENLGCKPQGDINTEDLYNEVIQKYDVYHIAVNDQDTSYSYYSKDIRESFGKYLGNNLKISTLNNLPSVINSCIANSIDNSIDNSTIVNTETITETITEGIPVVSW